MAFCDNDLCMYHLPHWDNVGSDRVAVAKPSKCKTSFPEWDGRDFKTAVLEEIQVLQRHLYITEEGESVFYCDECYEAIKD